MRFGVNQYDKAIESLQDGRGQLVPDGRCCVVCHDTGHQAWECGHNPLRAMAECAGLVRTANALHDRMHEVAQRGAKDPQLVEDLHDFLHYLIGVHMHMGSMVGPRSIVLPTDEP